MTETNPEEQLKEIANQLSCPTGENGMKAAKNMAANNHNMIVHTIEALDLQKADKILEVGFGGGSHVAELMKIAAELDYTGTDISRLMVEEASDLNFELLEAGTVRFALSDGEHIEYPDAEFDKVFSVNTIYFWKEPKAYVAELFRVLKPGGTLCLGFADRKFMEQLPFTAYVFHLYSLEEVEALFSAAGFDVDPVQSHQERVTSNAGEVVDRTFMVLNARRPNS